MVQDLKNSVDYKSAGVDIDAGNELVSRIRHIAKSTHRPEVLENIGGFGALVELPVGYQQPVLVSSTDGVGTKLKLAIELQQHDTVGIDLVAMCANDLIVCGAEPIYFLDYYATGKLNIDVAEQVITGIAEGCRLAGCALVGGETAEMPGMYNESDYDLAGFCVGIIEKSKIIDKERVIPGDAIIALPSSGPHSNGYSLIRKILQIQSSDFNTHFDDSGQSLAQQLMMPTRIYVNTALELIKNLPVHAICHVTGGGLIDNLPRVLPQFTKAVIHQHSWKLPSIFSWLQTQGNIDDQEMLRTFNCGVGIVFIVPKTNSSKTLDLLTQLGENPWVIGTIESNDYPEPLVEIIAQ